MTERKIRPFLESFRATIRIAVEIEEFMAGLTAEEALVVRPRAKHLMLTTASEPMAAYQQARAELRQEEEGGISETPKGVTAMDEFKRRRAK